jgi:succinate dehydrogenase / fumarate reductase iron-sulfur subunit/antitoxin CptB
MSDLDRIRWHSRRGLLELDLVLQRFNDCYLGELAPEQRHRFQELLMLGDNDLLDVVMGRADPISAEVAELVVLLRTI